jgi:hypothetical protein
MTRTRHAGKEPSDRMVFNVEKSGLLLLISLYAPANIGALMDSQNQFVGHSNPSDEIFLDFSEELFNL